ncbi:EP1-like glycoprotein 4 [Rhododendron vialii]|uniref:EP1-like glycoprotein 4 n=1 Tax=Rhododendron vialii TaxID=182163 RepID=UPI00265DA430|nr:EP1-like glycoprotein 4 [Rhododendron vialii]
MAKPSPRLIISFAISTTFFIYSAHLTNSQSVANLSTTWINNNPTIYISGGDLSPRLQMTPVFSPSGASQFVSGFYCFSEETTSCFFGIFIFGERTDYDTLNYSIIDYPQLVWSANRDRPVKVNATLKLTGNGDLILEDADGDMVWSTNTRGKSVAGLRFTEFGNLDLFDSNNATVWQSFDHPTDSLLIGQKLVSNSGQKLIARASSSNFSPGLYSLSVQNGLLFGYMEANPPVEYYKSTLEANPNSINSEKAYVVFNNGSFNGQNFDLASTAQFMRLEPDGHLKVCEWGGAK